MFGVYIDTHFCVCVYIVCIHGVSVLCVYVYIVHVYLHCETVCICMYICAYLSLYILHIVRVCIYTIYNLDCIIYNYIHKTIYFLNICTFLQHM